MSEGDGEGFCESLDDLQKEDNNVSTLFGHGFWSWFMVMVHKSRNTLTNL
jgi:hypothetical protein